MKILAGTTIRITVSLRNRDSGNMDDPVGITFKYREPGQVATSLVYGTDPEVSHVSAGTYQVLLTPGTGGEWPWRWETSGTLAVATQGTFEVEGANI